MPGVGLRRTVSYLRHEFASFASTGSGIRITHADGRAARQRERTRTPNATAAGICASSFVLEGSLAYSSTLSQYLTKRSSFASTAGGIRITHDPSEVENAHR